MGKITDNEFELLNICWKKKECTAREVFEESLKTKNRKYETIKTTLERMEKKGFLKRRKIGPVWLYTPNDHKKTFLNHMLDNFISTAFNGKPTPFLINLINRRELSQTDLTIIKKEIEKIEEN